MRRRGAVVIGNFPRASSPSPFAERGIQFVENATGDFDYGEITTLPNLFGDAEFTLKLVVKPNNAYSFGTTDTPTEILQNWSNEDVTRYSTAGWWWDGNFLLDGFNNTDFFAGSFGVQIMNGRVRWLFGDGSAADALTGDVWGVQDISTGTNVVDNQWHVIHLVRRWQSSPANSADLELWVDGVLEDTQNTSARTDMASTYWDSWTGFESNGWVFGAEKQAAELAGNDVEDFKGLLAEVAFYGGALSSTDIGNDQGSALTAHTDYLDHFLFDEGTGNPVSENGITMTLFNAQGGGFWP